MSNRHDSPEHAGVPHPEYWADRFPDKPALVMIETGEVLTYGKLARRANQASRAFSEYEIGPGDTIAILSGNNTTYPELLWAGKNSGIRYVTVSSHLNSKDAQFVVEDSGARILVTSYMLSDLACEIAPKLQSSMKFLMFGGVSGPFESYEALRNAQGEDPLPGRLRGSSMLYSSGTTGRPKGVQTELAEVPPEIPPHRFATMVAQYEFEESSIFMNPGPFYHAGPQRFMMMVHRLGGTILSSESFDPLRTLEAMEAYGATHGFFVPTMFGRMLRIPQEVRSKFDLSTVRHAIHAAAPCPHGVKRAMIDWWGPKIDELYSGTEGFGHTFITSEQWLERPGSVGKPPANCRIKIVGPDGATLPAGTPGRIMMSNGLRFKYHGQAAQGAISHDDEGFASLGDVGYLDEAGFLYLTDREANMIIAGGVNIYPQEAEQVLGSHPAVEDVAVIGIPDEDFGEQVRALVVRSTNSNASQIEAEELIAWCRARLSSYKCPRTVHFVECLPRNEMGKLVKRLLPPELSGG